MHSTISGALLGMAALGSAQQLSIMPLGASITWGKGSSSGNGYRGSLLRRLNEVGYEIDFVGSQQSGTMDDKDNEGHPGKHISEVHQIAEEQVPNYVPQVYCINVGTNDARENDDPEGAGDRMNDMLEFLWDATPDSTVILGSLTVNCNEEHDKHVQTINGKYAELSDKLFGEGRRIVFADMHNDNGPTCEDMSEEDGFHPTDAGFTKMADIWFDAIEEAKENGWFGEDNSGGNNNTGIFPP